MNFNEYQNEAVKTAVYGKNAKTELEIQWYPILGLAGEAGELANKAKKWLRDMSSPKRDDLVKELGDCLWYVSEIARVNDIPLDEIATTNINKLKSRLERGKITGSGDER